MRHVIREAPSGIARVEDLPELDCKKALPAAIDTGERAQSRSGVNGQLLKEAQSVPLE